MDNQVRWARTELERAGWFSKDSDYAGMVGEAVLKMVEQFSAEGHSGNSAHLCAHLFYQLARWKPLGPLTDDPSEWMEVSEGQWQSTRNPSCFSKDGGRTYYDLDGPRSWWRKAWVIKDPFRKDNWLVLKKRWLKYVRAEHSSPPSGWYPGP